MAVSFDASTAGNAGAVTSLTISHTTATGDNRLLWLSVILLDTTIDDFSAATYNGTSFFANQVTEVLSAVAIRRLATFYMIAPDTGTHDMVVTIDGTTTWLRGVVATYQGVAQTSPVDVSDSVESTAGTTQTLALTTTVDNTWLVGLFDAVSAGITAGSNTVLRAACTNDEPVHADSNSAQTPAGSHSLNFTESGSGNRKFILGAAIKPATASSSIKSINGLAQASVKSVNGLAIASVKSFNGLSNVS